MTIHVVLIHGGTSTIKKMEAVLPAATYTVIFENGLSSKYDEKTGLASKYPTLSALMSQYAPSWQPGEPLVIFAYSAGAWALRHYLRSATDRQQINAAIFLDGLYGNPPCNLETYAGVVDFGKLAKSDPDRHRLVLTYSTTQPLTMTCSKAIAAAAGSSPSVIEKGFALDHGSMQGVAGPNVFESSVAPWIVNVKSTAAAKRTQWPWAELLLAVGAGAGVVWWLKRSPRPRRRGKVAQ